MDLDKMIDEYGKSCYKTGKRDGFISGSVIGAVAVLAIELVVMEIVKNKKSEEEES